MVTWHLVVALQLVLIGVGVACLVVFLRRRRQK